MNKLAKNNKRDTIYNHLDIVKYLIDEEKLDRNIQNKNGDNILHWAVSKGNIDLAKYLIKEFKFDFFYKLGETNFSLWL